MILVCVLLVTGCGSDRQTDAATSPLRIDVDAALVVALPVAPDPPTADAPLLVDGSTGHVSAIRCDERGTAHHSGGSVTLSGNSGEAAIVLVAVVVVVGVAVLAYRLGEGLVQHHAHAQGPAHVPVYDLTLGSDTMPTEVLRLRNGQELWVPRQVIAALQQGAYNRMTLRTVGAAGSRPVQLALADALLRVLPSSAPRP